LRAEVLNMHALCTEFPSLRLEVSESMNVASLRTPSADHHLDPCKLTAAEIVATSMNTGALANQSIVRRSARPQKYAVGKLLHQKLQSARVLKPVNIFVSRLLPNTACVDVLL